MRRGRAANERIGAEVQDPHFLVLLAEGHERAGQTAEGLAVLAEALAKVEKTGERFYEAELHRLKGELLLKAARGIPNGEQSRQKTKPGVHPSAEACFDKAIALARQQCAKSLELRAVMSLSRLRQQQGKTEEAREQLAEVYSWFTEGLDTNDLQDARALVQSLN